VTWAGLPSHPHHERAARYLPLGPGSVFAFGVRPTGEFADEAEESAAARATGEAVIANLQLASHLANIGDARTLVIHPASTTHQQLSAEQLAAGGVRPDLIRISVGLEDVEDILWDLDQAITAATGRTREEQA
jgi:O-acetylhomoserine (thiol)-lyase